MTVPKQKQSSKYRIAFLVYAASFMENAKKNSDKDKFVWAERRRQRGLQTELEVSELLVNSSSAVVLYWNLDERGYNITLSHSWHAALFCLLLTVFFKVSLNITSHVALPMMSTILIPPVSDSLNITLYDFT